MGLAIEFGLALIDGIEVQHFRALAFHKRTHPFKWPILGQSLSKLFHLVWRKRAAKVLLDRTHKRFQPKSI